MTAIDNRQDTLALNQSVALTGLYPSGSGGSGSDLSLGAIRTYGFNFLPGGSSDTDGGLLPIASNQALFSLIGTTFGGDGTVTFGLPDLENNLGVGQGSGSGLPSHSIGAEFGSDNVNLTIQEIPAPPGSGQSFDNSQDSVAIVYAVNTGGNYPGGTDHGFLGEINAFAVLNNSSALPRGWVPAEGQLISIASNSALFSILGTTYGGDGENTFALPDLRGRVPVGAGTGPGDTPVALGQQFGSPTTTLSQSQLPGTVGGSDQSVDNVQPSLGVNYLVSLSGVFPTEGSGEPSGTESFVGELTAFAGNFAPTGFAFAQGQLLSIASNSALFSLYGTTYGGDGVTTFALPDLRGRSIIDESTANPIGSTQGQDSYFVSDANLAGVVAPDINGDEFANNLNGTGFDENINGLAGDDVLTGGLGDDTLNGGDDIDTANYSTAGGGVTVNLNTVGAQNTGAAGTDTLISIENLIGSNFNDHFTGTTGATGNNVFSGGAGNDLLAGIGGDDILNGGDNNDNLQGGAGVDVLNGDDGDDQLRGGTENDELHGGLGRDLLYGQAGADTFVLDSLADSGLVYADRDVIRDFNQAEGDKIDLSAIDAIAGGADDAFSFLGTFASTIPAIPFTNVAGQLFAVNSAGGQTVIWGDVNGDSVQDFTLVLDGALPLTAGDFIL